MHGAHHVGVWHGPHGDLQEDEGTEGDLCGQQWLPATTHPLCPKT